MRRMSRHLEEMALFPLNTVLFPHASLSLHIFEERYKQMIRDCERDDRPFGVVLIREGDEVGGVADPYLVGTAVRIVRNYTYPDGALDIQVLGERRFRIRELDDSMPYLRGRVEPILEADFLEEASQLPLVHEARAQFEMLIHRLFSREDFNVEVVFPSDPVALSFTIANLLPIGNLEKQRLLETTDTLERMESLIPILQMQNQQFQSPATVKLSSQELQDWVTPN